MSDQSVHFLEINEIERRRTQLGTAYLEFLRVPSMSGGVYVLATGGADRQSPHQQDEMYYVIRGAARMRVGPDDHVVGQGSLIFVAAHIDHRFFDITEELTVLVFFAPAETE